MPKAAAKNITTVRTVDPVVDMARELLFLWDADEASQREFSAGADGLKDETHYQFDDRRKAIQELASFRQAKSLDGALVQLALTLDALEDMSNLLDPGEKDQKALNQIALKIERLIRSSIRALRQTVGPTAIEPAVNSLLSIHGCSQEGPKLWIDRAKGWAEKGSVLRNKVAA